MVLNVTECKEKLNVYGYAFLLLMSAVYSLTNTSLEIKGITSTSFIFLASFLFLAFVIYEKRFTLDEIVVMLTLLLIGCIHYLKTKETVFLIMLMTAIIFTRINYRRCFKLLFLERLSFLIVIISLSILGILSQVKMEIFKGGISENVIGYSLGFNHPNQLAYNFGLLLLLYICYKGEKIKQINIICIIGCCIACYSVTKTRTILVVAVILFAMLEFYKFSIKRKKLINYDFIIWKLAPFIMLICALIALVPPFFMSTATGKFKTILFSFNGLIGSRYTHSARVFELYPIPFWGGVVEFKQLQFNYGYSIVDNGYLCLLYDFGILGFSVFMILYYFTIKELVEKKLYYYVVAIISLSLWAITENILRSFAINFTVAFWSECIVKNIFSMFKYKMRVRR